jgi:micrococcal nuclease
VYTYRASAFSLVDGDTFDADLDVGFHLMTRQRLRLLNYDAPESSGATADMGAEAKHALEWFLKAASSIEVRTEKSDSFGRYLADVMLTFEKPTRFMGPRTYHGPTDLVEALVSLGYGRHWNGKGKRPPWDPKALYPKGLDG